MQVDSVPEQTVWGNQTTLLGSFSRGAHVVRLLDIPRFCHVIGEASASVSVRTGGLTQDTVLVTFAVSCEPDPDRNNRDAFIAFEHSDSIALVRDDGSTPFVLTAGVAPSWSPDGKFVAFQRHRCVSVFGCNDELWMIRPDGSGARTITQSQYFSDSDPAVSPDGRMIALIRFSFGPDYSDLVVTDLNGTSARTLSIWEPYSTPAWSPDGTQIAFTCDGFQRGTGLDICVVPMSDSCGSYTTCKSRRLVDTPFDDSEPAWSPDGKRIAFTLTCRADPCPSGLEAGGSYIGLLDPVTRAVTRVVVGHSPAWAPDGQRIIFAGNASNPGLHIINLDGSGIRTLTDDPRDTAPSWR
jgi:Tol biopolymer transport system component